MKRGERHPLEEMLRTPGLEPANDNTNKKSIDEPGEKNQEPPPVPEGDAKEAYKQKIRKQKEKEQEPPPLPETDPETEEDIDRKKFFREQKKTTRDQKNKKRVEAETKKRDKEKKEEREEKDRKEFHEDAHEENARKKFFKKAKGEELDEEKIAETREKINDLDLNPNEKETKLAKMQSMIQEIYDIKLNEYANPKEETDAKKMKRLGDILNGRKPEDAGFFKRLFGGVSEADRMKAKSFKNDYDAYVTLADELAEAAEHPRRGKKKNGLGEPIVIPPKYQWM